MAERNPEIEKYLEGLDKFSYSFFFPLEKELNEDLQEILNIETKSEEKVEEKKQFLKYLKLDTSTTEYTKTQEESKETTELEEMESLSQEIDELPSFETRIEQQEVKTDLPTFDEEPLTAEDLEIPSSEEPIIPSEHTDFDLNLGDISSMPDLDLSDTKLEEPLIQDTPSSISFEQPEPEMVDLEIEQPSTKDFTSDIPSVDTSLEEPAFDSSQKEPSFDPSVEPLTVDFTSANESSFELGLDEKDLQEMQQQSLMDEGIGKELSEEELAKLRATIIHISEHLRKVIIDAIVNEKLSRTDQRLLLNMLIDEAEESTIADFIEEKLGFRPQVSVDKTKEGIPIIYTDEVSPEALERRRKRIKSVFLFSISGFLSIVLFLAGLRFYVYYTTSNLYEKGLKEIYSLTDYNSPDSKQKIEKAEQYFMQALQNEKEFNIKYFNKYGIAYYKKGIFDKSFEKLFGIIEPEYIWNSSSFRVPLIQKITPWKSLEEISRGEHSFFQSRDQIKRKLIFPGGFTTSRLRDEKFNKENLMYLAKFHSLNVPFFLKSEIGQKYKNDDLAIDYYKIILTLMNQPNDIDALTGIAKIYYNQKKYSLTTNEFQKIIDIYPDNIEGHEGILNTYIEIWKVDKDPRYVIAKHRYIQQLGLEKKISIYTLAKLAGFYIDIDPEELRIKYNVDPVNSLNQLDIKSTAEYLINLVFDKEEDRDDEKIEGKKYGEGFYQRGRLLKKQKQYKESVRQFQNAFYYDPKHFPAINYIGEYYLYQLKDYENAKKYFLKSIEIYYKNNEFFGIRPEDETLMSFDTGIVFYNLASTIFEKHKDKFIPLISSLKEPSESYTTLLREFNSTKEYNMKALELLKDQNLISNTRYRNSFIDYINSNFDDSLKELLKIENLDNLYNSPNYYLILGNISFYKSQFNLALSYFKQTEELLEKYSSNKKNPILNQLIYQVYNNIGSSYEALYYQKQKKLPNYKLEELKQRSLEYYYKAIEFGIQNQILPIKSRLNLDFSFKRETDEIQLEDTLVPNLIFLNKE